MRVLRAHHMTNLVAVVDSFLPRAAANPRGGRQVVLHPRNHYLTAILKLCGCPANHEKYIKLGRQKKQIEDFMKVDCESNCDDKVMDSCG